jgi:chromosome partitioning protein
MFAELGVRTLAIDLDPQANLSAMFLDDEPAPRGDMQPVGYVVMQHSARDGRPVRAHQNWLNQIPAVYREAVLSETSLANAPQAPEQDPHNLALLKHYRSLMPMAMNAHKPMFSLKQADGVIGAHVEAVRSCHTDFSNLARRIASEVGLKFE